jgi:hypothetical protein
LKKQQIGIQDLFRRKVEDFTSGYWDIGMKSMAKPLENKPQSCANLIDASDMVAIYPS